MTYTDLRLEGDGDRCIDSMNIEPPHEPATGLRRPRAIWPWAWLALEGVATVGWLIALGWATVVFARWLLG
jgi:hypothetical protein